MKPQTRRQRFQQHIEQLRALGRQDAARRCSCCRRALPTTGVVQALPDQRLFCSLDCLEEFEERLSLLAR